MRVRSPKRTCTCCKKEYPASVEFFAPQKRGLFGLTATCKPCRAKKSNLYHAKNPTSRINNQLRRKFGITLAQYELMYVAQNGMCAICYAHQDTLTKRLAVDHDHDTGKVRALLCHPCNVGIGLFKENPAALARAIDYVNRHHTLKLK